MPPVGFKPTISTGQRPQTYAFDLAATGTGMCLAVGHHNEKGVEEPNKISQKDMLLLQW
jgi:hypothetical protein